MKLRQGTPLQAKTHYSQGVACQLRGDLDGAIQSYREAVIADEAVTPDEEQLMVEAAIELQETAAGQYPDSANRDRSQLLDCDREKHILVEALNAWQKSRMPQAGKLPQAQIHRYSNAWYNLGCAAMLDYGRLDECISYFQKAVEINPDHVLARFNELFVLNYSPDQSPADIAAKHFAVGQWLDQLGNAQKKSFSNEHDEDRVLRIAYLSSDFRDHSVAHFILPVLESHDHSRFEIYVYHNHFRTDEITRRAQRAAFQYLEVAGMNDADLMKQIAGDRIDLLVELNGLSRGNRLTMLAQRAAPVQLSWLGYPNTTGLKSMDYRIVDAVTDPEDQPGNLNSEKLIRMPDVFSVYQPPPGLPAVGSAPFRKNGFITFGSFNNLPKITAAVLNAWAAILNALPESRILIKSRMLQYQNPARRLLRDLLERGVAEDRIDMVGYSENKTMHLGFYNRVDICLDTFPYNGTTTTCDSLIMGVPVITLEGEDHRSRVGASQLRALGLDDLLAGNENDYVENAVSLALDPDRLQSLRANLRNRMKSSPLMDAVAFTKELEANYQKAWTEWCKSA
jgi:predicted O-linked N-acetylglucosamine transferase (SPINDLY family)